MTITTKILDSFGFVRNSFFQPKKINFPDFLGIGIQKSGTTWLYKNLKQHPQLYLPETKEVHFFDWYFYKSLGWYCNHFINANKEHIKGEITPGYSIISEEKIKFIKNMNPKLKIILLLRNPIERAWSHAVMNLSSIPERNVNSISDEKFIAHFNNPRSIERGNYPKIISKWNKYFTKEQIYVESYNQIKNSPKILLNDVFKFLGVNQMTNWKSFPIEKEILPVKRKKNYKKIPTNLKEYLTKFYRKDLEKLKNIYPLLNWDD